MADNHSTAERFFFDGIFMFRIDEEFHSWIAKLSPEEFAQLEENIKTDGCRDPLVVWNGILLDGHNRYDICYRNGIAFETSEIELPDRNAALDWIDANQLGRRNLTPDQAKLYRGRRYNRMKKRVGEHEGNQYTKLESGQNVRIPTSQTLAQQHGVTERTIRRDGKVAEMVEKLAKTNPVAAQAVRDGTKRINEVRREVRREEVKQAAKLPDAKYRILYADCPWKYGDQLTEDYGPTKYHYPAMSISELCALPIAPLCEKDAVLFFWVTSPLLEDAFPVIKAWGFQFKTSFVWDKVKHNMGHYNSVRHELLLVCTRGSCLPDNPKLFDSVQSIERTEHSAKPEEFRAIIDTLYPHGKRLELFARVEVEGWDRWGNQS